MHVTYLGASEELGEDVRHGLVVVKEDEDLADSDPVGGGQFSVQLDQDPQHDLPEVATDDIHADLEAVVEHLHDLA